MDDKNTISVLLVQPNKYPKQIEIENSIEAMEAVVGGEIEEYMPFKDDVALLCVKDAKIAKLPLNRAIYTTQPQENELTYRELKERFKDAESRGEHITGYIVFAQESFTKPYPVESRTYAISSDNKAFNCRMGGYSIFGSCLDGSDAGVRLDRYMRDERGGTDGWKIEKCYTVSEGVKISDVVRGNFLICKAPIESKIYESLSPEMADRYFEKFKYPEKFHSMDDGIKAVPFKPIRADKER